MSEYFRSQYLCYRTGRLRVQPAMSFFLARLLPVLCMAHAFCQPPPSANAAPIESASGAFFAISVADAKVSSQWYASKLGLRVVMETPKTGGATAIVLEGGGLIVELIQRDDAMPLNKAATIADPLRIHGFVKAGVIVDDFDRTMALLKQRNVEIAFGPFPARGGQRANVIIKDNAGNLIQLFGKR